MTVVESRLDSPALLLRSKEAQHSPSWGAAEDYDYRMGKVRNSMKSKTACSNSTES